MAKRVRRLSKMTENISKTMLAGVGIVAGSVMKPVVKSPAGKAMLAMVPGQVLLASLDAVSKFQSLHILAVEISISFRRICKITC